MENCENFKNTISDFLTDLKKTFPEYSADFDKWDLEDSDVLKELFDYCLKFYPERFFDILYQNYEIFEKDNETNTFFLPNVDFKLLFSCEDLSSNSKNAIWKYLQLILFSVVGSIKDKEGFGDTANLFEGIDENDLSEKLKDTMNDINGFFSNMGLDMDNLSEEMKNMDTSESNENTENTDNTENPDNQKKEFNFEGMPNLENLQEHLKGLFDGKIGKLAKELAEEMSGDFSDFIDEKDKDSVKSTEDVLKKMMKDPKKIINMIKSVGDKIKNKMESGEISKDELMSEASELMSKMKEMGGADQFGDILKKFAGGMGMGKNAKINKNALKRMEKTFTMRERMLKKMQNKKENFVVERSDNDNLVFSVNDEEKQLRSSIAQKSEDEILAWIGEEDCRNNDSNVVKKPKKKKNKKK